MIIPITGKRLRGLSQLPKWALWLLLAWVVVCVSGAAMFLVLMII
jgi:hypothetical protein